MHLFARQPLYAVQEYMQALPILMREFEGTTENAAALSTLQELLSELVSRPACKQRGHVGQLHAPDFKIEEMAHECRCMT